MTADRSEVARLREIVREFLRPAATGLWAESTLSDDDPIPFSPYTVDLIRWAQALLAERPQEEPGPDAARWRAIRPFLRVDGDTTDPDGQGKHVEWLVVRDDALHAASVTESIGATVEHLTDRLSARAADAREGTTLDGQ